MLDFFFIYFFSDSRLYNLKNEGKFLTVKTLQFLVKSPSIFNIQSSPPLAARHFRKIF